jgi:hypothetical protein
MKEKKEKKVGGKCKKKIMYLEQTGTSDTCKRSIHVFKEGLPTYNQLDQARKR